VYPKITSELVFPDLLLVLGGGVSTDGCCSRFRKMNITLKRNINSATEKALSAKFHDFILAASTWSIPRAVNIISFLHARNIFFSSLKPTERRTMIDHGICGGWYNIYGSPVPLISDHCGPDVIRRRLERRLHHGKHARGNSFWAGVVWRRAHNARI